MHTSLHPAPGGPRAKPAASASDAGYRAPVGFDLKTFSGPFLTFLGFAQTLIPLALLRLYFVAQRSGERCR